MNTTAHSRTALLVFAIVSAGVGSCEDAPTTAVVENRYTNESDAAANVETPTVFKAWWVTALFASPVAPGATSETERVIPGSDFAYALLAPGWSPEQKNAPPRLIAVRSADRLSVATNDLLRIEIADDTFVGNCAAASTLGADEARLIVERIFPGDFAGLLYDPATCSVLFAADAGTPNDGDSASDATSHDSSTD